MDSYGSLGVERGVEFLHLTDEVDKDVGGRWHAHFRPRHELIVPNLPLLPRLCTDKEFVSACVDRAMRCTESSSIDRNSLQGQ